MSRSRKPVPHPLTVLGQLHEQAAYLRTIALPTRATEIGERIDESAKRIVELCQLLERAMLEQATNHGGKPNE